MPNKQRKHQKQNRPPQTVTKFEASPHPSLSLSRPDTRNPDPQGTSVKSSVEECLRSLRREEAKRLPPRPPPVATVHPSLRNLLDVPETPQPRPRPGGRSAGQPNGRRIPGPAAPPSWQLSPSRHASDVVSREYEACSPTNPSSWPLTEQHVLPGADFPPKDTLLHMTLKTMARRWHWHLEHDSSDLGSVPVHLKEVLLSYLGSYCQDSSLRKSSTTLRLLFPDSKHRGPETEEGEAVWDCREDVKRLDLGRAMGTWLNRLSSLKRQIVREHVRQGPISLDLKLNRDHNATAVIGIPESWDDSASAAGGLAKQQLLAAPLCGSPVLRFPHLLHLSLSISPETATCPSIASWPALLSLAPHLSTLQSLSLGYWPSPTLTPHAAAISATIRNPVSRSLPVITYGGTDRYTESESNWREAAGILKKLSRQLYCLRWLDLTGCGSWFGALSWKDSGTMDEGSSLGARQYSAGPEWNASWRNVEYLGLSVGWSAPACHLDDTPPANRSNQDVPSRADRLRLSTTGGGSITQDWDVEEERRRYSAKKELERHRIIGSRAREVIRSLRALREAARGKWIQVGL